MTDEPKRVGRPRSTDPWRTVGVRFRQSDLDEVDRARGEKSASEFVREAALRAIGRRPDS